MADIFDEARDARMARLNEVEEAFKASQDNILSQLSAQLSQQTAPRATFTPTRGPLQTGSTAGNVLLSVLAGFAKPQTVQPVVEMQQRMNAANAQARQRVEELNLQQESYLRLREDKIAQQMADVQRKAAEFEARLGLERAEVEQDTANARAAAASRQAKDPTLEYLKLEKDFLKEPDGAQLYADIVNFSRGYAEMPMDPKDPTKTGPVFIADIQDLKREAQELRKRVIQAGGLHPMTKQEKLLQIAASEAEILERIRATRKGKGPPGGPTKESAGIKDEKTIFDQPSRFEQFEQFLGSIPNTWDRFTEEVEGFVEDFILPPQSQQENEVKAKRVRPL